MPQTRRQGLSMKAALPGGSRTQPPSSFPFCRAMQLPFALDGSCRIRSSSHWPRPTGVSLTSSQGTSPESQTLVSSWGDSCHPSALRTPASLVPSSRRLRRPVSPFQSRQESIITNVLPRTSSRCRRPCSPRNCSAGSGQTRTRCWGPGWSRPAEPGGRRHGRPGMRGRSGPQRRPHPHAGPHRPRARREERPEHPSPSQHGAQAGNAPGTPEAALFTRTRRPLLTSEEESGTVRDL